MKEICLISLCLLLWSSSYIVNASHKIEQGKETWGYVTVRDGAHMFFWLYYATTENVDYKTRPLVIWLQGGPGASSTGIGNFMEIGPQDQFSNNRTNAWTKDVNVLFVDNPVGTGFSYVDNSNLLPTNNSAIASDLVEFMKEFLIKVPEFQNIPVYIFAESYGGKMAVSFAMSLYKAVDQKKIACQFVGVALGDSWISPLDSVLSWAPYLYALSMVDSVGFLKVNTSAYKVADAIKNHHMADATIFWSETEDVVENVTHGVNMYNILSSSSDKYIKIDDYRDTYYSYSHPNKISDITEIEIEEKSIEEHILKLTKEFKFSNKNLESLYHRHVGKISSTLSDFMNGPIRQKLKIIPENVTWGGQSELVFEALATDFMNPVILQVESLLNLTTLKVVVYNGQLDLIVDTPGVEKWVENLHWEGTKSWLVSERTLIENPTGMKAAYSKSFKNFTFYWILNAGHMVPLDVGSTASLIMCNIVGLKHN